MHCQLQEDNDKNLPEKKRRMEESRKRGEVYVHRR
jgi:hypothetical protein